jgi:glycosyltransferase involved in cell wall biosynthesis
MIGPVNHPHLEHLAKAIADQGHEIVVGGWEWEELPPSTLPEAGIRVDLRREPTRTWLRGLMRESRPHVVHVQWMEYALLAALYGARPLVATAWGSDVYLATRFYRVANRFVVRRADAVLTDSVDLLDALIGLGAPPNRAAVMNWGVDLGLFHPPEGGRGALRRRLGLDDVPTILSPRWLRDPYNPEVILAAFDRVADEVPEAQLILKHLATEEPDLGASRHRDRVRVVGHVPYEQIPDYYRAADVCVSIPSSDSSPRSVWEAMACGCPCVVSDLPWVLRLIQDPGQHGQISEAARALVERHRNQELEMRRLSALYRDLATSPDRWPLRRRLNGVLEPRR